MVSAAAPRPIIAPHVLPNLFTPLATLAVLEFARVILAEAALSFLGLGVQPPTPSWGTMINGGRAHLIDAPHLTVFPGLAIALVVLGFNFLGDHDLWLFINGRLAIDLGGLHPALPGSVTLMP